MIRVQYSPERELMPYFQRYGFMYDPTQWWSGITSMNKLRNYSEALGICNISRQLIVAILHHSWGVVLGNAVNTNGHNTTVCFVHIERYRQTVFWALLAWVVRWHLTQLWLEWFSSNVQLPVVMNMPRATRRMTSYRQISHPSEWQWVLDFSE